MHPTKKSLSRRKFLFESGMLGAGLMLLPRKFLFQQSPVDLIINEAVKSPISIEKLRNNISLLQGSGGNIGVLTGPDGMLMIDAGIDVSKNKITQALASLSDKPLKYLVNTHWHFDHTSGNEWLHNYGATLVAHANTKKNLSRQIRVEEWKHTFPAAPEGALPSIVFDKHHALNFNNTDLDLHYLGNAHTDSDISVHFKKEDVLFVGDIWWNGYYPFIDADTNGNINGMIDAVDHCLKKVSADTIIIPGHGARGNKRQLASYRDMLTDIRDRVRASKQKGKTLQQVLSDKPTKAYDPVYGKFVINGDWFVRLVYSGV